MTCRLCNLEKDLRQSHIVPKFIYRWLKETGGNYFRSPETPNQRLHDGLKPKMLCQECEQLFSKLENNFARNIFHPHVKKGKNDFEYDSNVYGFAVSIVWRVLQYHYSTISQYPNFSDLLLEAEKEWKNFLFQDIPIKKFNKIHLVFTTHGLNYDVQPVERFLYYYSRGIDGSVYTNEHFGFVYAKLGRIIIIAEIVNNTDYKFSNSLISNTSGTFNTNEMKLETIFKVYIINRLKIINEAFKQMSENQKEIVFKYADKRMKDFERSETSIINAAQLTMKVDEDFLDF